MDIKEQIQAYIASQPEPKRSDMQTLDRLIRQAVPEGRLWFSDGRSSNGKIVTNPTIGYGFYILKYADGSTRDFFQIGLLANKTGISVHILGIADKTYLPQNFGHKIGKASVTGYCVKFKALKDIHIDILEAAIRYGLGHPNKEGQLST